MIVLLGSASDPQVDAIAQQLVQMRADHVIWDSGKFPQTQQMSYFPLEGQLKCRIGENELSTSDVHSLYWRSFQTPGTAEKNHLARRDAESLVFSFLNLLGDRAVNSFDAIRFHREKPRQLAAVAAIGITIPETYVGNDADAVRTFCASHQHCIFKPVTGGDYATSVGPGHLSDEHLNRSLSQSPITLQRFVRGTNVRSYVIGDSLYSAEIRSSLDDFRLDPNSEIKPIELPDDIANQARLARQHLGLSWTAIDWRRDEEGKYFFLEANPSPMFVNFERRTGYPLSARLASLLVH